MKPKIVFSDVDGTLVHYEKDFSKFARIEASDDPKYVTLHYIHTNEFFNCAVLPSLTGGNAYLSLKTIDLVQKIREYGVKFVIITGARSTTFFQRRPILPRADYEFMENGGRMLINGKIYSSWTESFVEQVGKYDYSQAIPADIPIPESRDGELWEFYRELSAEGGWYLDARDYYTDFRVDFKKSDVNRDEDALRRKLQKRSNLACTLNLGKADVYPISSGKANAARFVLDIEKASAHESVAMFDDDNDIELGELCGTGILPGVTHSSVIQAAQRNPHWTITSSKGVKGTEEALESILAMLK